MKTFNCSLAEICFIMFHFVHQTSIPGNNFNPLYSDGLSNMNKSNKDGIVYYIYLRDHLVMMYSSPRRLF